jgi:hypothetical protein
MERSYHAIKDINKKMEIWKLTVIVDQLWSTFKGDKDDTLEMLLRDINVSILKDLFIYLIYMFYLNNATENGHEILIIGRYYSHYYQHK